MKRSRLELSYDFDQANQISKHLVWTFGHVPPFGRNVTAHVRDHPGILQPILPRLPLNALERLILVGRAFRRRRQSSPREPPDPNA